MNIAELLKLAALFVMFSFLPGCYLPFGTLEVVKPDPLRKQAVKIIKVTGRTITLADGRKFELAGLKPPSDGLDPHHVRDMQADMANWQEMVGFLISKGADLNVAGGTEMVLHYFCRPGETEIFKLLVEHGANPNSVHKWNTPLHLTAERGAMKTADFLISQGVDVNAKDPLRENTPLHVAVEWDKKEMVELLISKGADVNIRGNGRRRPLTMARHRKHDEIAKILRAHGAHE